jgi:hypothetical protein
MHHFDRSSRVVAHSVLNGLHHEYSLVARAASMWSIFAETVWIEPEKVKADRLTDRKVAFYKDWLIVAHMIIQE